MNAVEIAPIVKSLDIACSAARAFHLFTAEIFAWWPVASHSRARDADGEQTVAVTIEPRVGGRVFETLNTGEQRDWGEVLAWEPGQRFAMLWAMGRPRAESTEVDVHFARIDEKSCRVTLTHSHWDRMGEKGPEMHGRYDSGWDFVFGERYAKHVRDSVQAAGGRL